MDSSVGFTPIQKLEFGNGAFVATAACPVASGSKDSRLFPPPSAVWTGACRGFCTTVVTVGRDVESSKGSLRGSAEGGYSVVDGGCAIG